MQFRKMLAKRLWTLSSIILFFQISGLVGLFSERVYFVVGTSGYVRNVCCLAWVDVDNVCILLINMFNIYFWVMV